MGSDPQTTEVSGEDFPTNPEISCLLVGEQNENVHTNSRNI
jgi:hypothetical protein